MRYSELQWWSDANSLINTKLPVAAIHRCFSAAACCLQSEMDEDEKRNTDDSRQSQELHNVPLEPSRHLADEDEGTKTFHMAPRRDGMGWPEGYGRDHWPVYDPFTGLRTAAVLGGLMLLMLIYILYKTRCGGRIGRRRWTSKDRLFVERYKRKVSSQVCQG